MGEAGCAAEEEEEEKKWRGGGGNLCQSVSFVFGCHLSTCGMIVAAIHLLSSG